MNHYSLTLEQPAAAADLEVVQTGLAAYNQRVLGVEPARELAVFLRDGDHNISGGVYGEIR